MSIDKSRFYDAIKDVIAWNAFARGGVHSFDEESFKLQQKIVREEIFETQKAILNEDTAEVLDGIADIFVTYSYFDFMFHDGEIVDLIQEFEHELDHYELDFTLFDDYTLSMNNFDSISYIRKIVDDIDGYTSSTYGLLELYFSMHAAEKLYNVSMMDVIEHVMESNWSKFPTKEQLTRFINEECDWIESNRGFKDVACIENEGRLIFRADQGFGKIMKPSVYFAADCSMFL